MNYNKFINLTHSDSKKSIDRICNSILLGLETDYHRFQTIEDSSLKLQIAVLINVLHKMCSFHTRPTLFIIFYFIFLVLYLMKENNDLVWNSLSISMTKTDWTHSHPFQRSWENDNEYLKLNGKNSAFFFSREVCVFFHNAKI